MVVIRSATWHHRETSLEIRKSTLEKVCFFCYIEIEGGGAHGADNPVNIKCPIACCIFLFSQQTKLTNTLHDISTTMQLMSSRLDDIEDAMRKGGEHGKKEKERS